MAQVTTIARPYARAVFEIAREAKDFDGWQQQLDALAGLVAAPEMRAAIGNPKFGAEVLVQLVFDVVGERLSTQGRNLVQVLAARKRLTALPEVLSQFVALRRDAERVIEVELVSAVPVEAAQQQRFAKALEAKLGRSVQIKNVTDPSLIGGALLRAGDTVIDGSVRGRLERLAVELAR